MQLISTHPIKKSDLGFHANLFGGKLLAWLDASAAAYASSVTSTTLTLQNATGGAIDADIVEDDIIIIQTTSKFDGDQLRDHYLVVELQNSNYSQDVELYAVNIKFKSSKLDDSLGNQGEIQ